jgi:hypothetical protein
MIRKLALAGTLSLVLAGLAWAANAPTYQDPVGQTRDAQGVVLIDTTGAPYKAASSGGGAVTEADGANVTLGAKADAKSTATDTTAITLMQVAKQISASVQAAAASLAAALPAGEAHLGEVGSNEITLTSAITSTAVTYTAGQSIGGLLTIANAARVSSTAGAPGTSGLIQKAVLGSSVTNTVQVDVVWFNANPTGSTCTNAAAYSLAAADRSKVIGFTHITDWEASAVAYSGQAQNLAMPYALTSATSIFACVVTRGSIVGAGTSDFTLDTGVIRN